MPLTKVNTSMVSSGGGDVASNAALGSGALNSNTTGANNTAVGFSAGYSNITGNQNTYIGRNAGYSATTATACSIVGSNAGYSNQTGNNNTFFGDTTGYFTTGVNNTFIGGDAGYLITTGSRNTILGRYSGNSSGLDIRTANNHVVLSDGDGNPRGWFAPSTGFILQGQSNTANPYIASYDSALYMYGRSTSSSGVFLAHNATSWSSTSDERRKDIIEPITDAANKVSQLRAVIGKFKTDDEGTRRPFLIAQDVQAVLPEAVQTQEDKDGEFLGMSYTDVVPLLVAAIKEQQAIINDLKARIETLEAK